MKNSKRWLLFLAALSVFLVTAVGFFVQSQNAQSTSRVSSRMVTSDISGNKTSETSLSVFESATDLKSQRLTALAEQAGKGGKIRIIVGLKVDFTPEGDLSRRESQNQQMDIKAAQNSFLGKYVNASKEDSSSNVRLYDYIPFVAMEAGAESLERFRNDPLIVSVEEDMILAPTLAESNAIIGSAAVWAQGYEGTGKAIAILDTGVDKNHDFLAGKVVSEACYSSNVSGTATSVCPGGVTESTATNSGLHCNLSVNGCNHGTHVAGISSGVNASISGVAKASNIIAIQVFSRFDSTTNCGNGNAPCALTYNSDYLKGLERVYALSGTIDVAAVNMSLGGGQYTGYCDTASPSVKAAIDNLRSINIPTVISTGNNGYTNATGFPSCISSAISVGNTGDGSLGAPLDTVWTTSNGSAVTKILAPGRWITSSVPSPSSTNSFAAFTGTSMSAPHVAGAWALFKQHSPDATVTDVLNAMTYSGQRITDTRNGIVFPRLNVQGAYNILENGPPAPLSGTVNVGSGQTYTSLTNIGGLFHTIGLAGLGGNLTVNITSNLTGETGGYELDQLTEHNGNNYQITIRPSGAARTITGTSGSMSGLININAADRVVIDGSLTEGGNDRSLTIANNQATNSTVIWVKSAVGNGANNVTIKNTVIHGAPGPNSTTTIGILSGGSIFGNEAEAANNDLTIENNWIYRVQNSLYLRGGAGANIDQNLRVLNNELGFTVANDNNIFRGMLFGNSRNFIVSGNTVQGVTSTATAAGAVNGIQLAFAAESGVIAGNRISGIKSISSTGTGAFGITLGSASATANITVVNNMISDVSAPGSATTASNGHGIAVNSGGGYNIYFNSVNMNTDQSSGISSAFYVGSGVTAAGTLNVRNNIFANTQTTGAIRYSVYSVAAVGVYSAINHNNYFTTQNVGFLGTDSATLADWRTASGQDANSLSVDPLFISATDLHVQGGSPMIGAGSPISGVTIDFDGEARSATTPTIGADEIVVEQAVASLGGRVTTANGRGLSNARVQISGGGLSSPRIAFTNAFGYYNFVDLSNGGQYTISVTERRNTFTVSSIVLTLNGSLTNVDFVAN